MDAHATGKVVTATHWHHQNGHLQASEQGQVAVEGAIATEDQDCVWYGVSCEVKRSGGGRVKPLHRYPLNRKRGEVLQTGIRAKQGCGAQDDSFQPLPTAWQVGRRSPGASVVTGYGLQQPL